MFYIKVARLLALLRLGFTTHANADIKKDPPNHGPDRDPVARECNLVSRFFLLGHR